MGTVAIIDYGSGNLRSAAKAFACAADRSAEAPAVLLTSRPEDLVRADHVVLPGVGAFAACKHGLETLDGMHDALEEQVVRHGKPLLGICVGMQLFADSGHEHGLTPGFGWIPGEVVALTPAPNLDGQPLKIPHMGWNRLSTARCHPVLNDLGHDRYVYFVHSFHMTLACDGDLLATVDYGQTVTAAIGRDNIIGTQFHPEKSQAVGLQLIENFLAWRP